MKTFSKNKFILPQPYRGIRAVWIVLALFASAMAGWGQNVIIDQFNSQSEVNNYQSQGWNGSPATFALSSSFPSYGSGSSGSMQMNVTYGPGENGPGIALSAPPFPLNAARATYLEFDVMVPANSGLDPNGNASFFQIGFQLGAPSYSYDQIAGFWLGPYGTNFTAGTWQHIVVPVPSTISSSSTAFNNLIIDPYDSTYATPTTNIVLIDNIQLDIPPATAPHYPNYVGFTFDSSNSVTPTSSVAGTSWYGQPTTIAWVTNNSTLSNTNITAVAGSGSAYITATFAGSSDIDNSDIIGLAFDTNYFVNAAFPAGENDTNYIIDGYHYSAVEFDILWDTNNSTMPLDSFNSMGDIDGVPLGMFCQGNAQQELGTSDPNIPDAASNGWVHMVVPISSSTPGINQIIGLWLKKYGNGANGAIAGTAAYYIDNVVFDGTVIPQVGPQMTLTPAVKGLNALPANGPYDREGLVTFDTDFSFVSQPAPVTYSFNIAQFPSAAYAGFDARLYLVPNGTASESDPDYVEPNLIMIQAYLNANGLASVGILVKTNAPNGNGNLYSQAVYYNTTNSGAVGNWSFKFSGDTNILVTAPDGETGSLILPLDDADLQSLFGSTMVVYIGGFDNAVGQGQDMVFGNVGITSGSTSLLFDNFATDTTISPNEWLTASSGAPGTVFLTSLTTEYWLSWTAPASGFFVQTNNNLLNNSAWSTNDPFSPVNYGNYLQTAVDVTNVPASGPLFFRLNNNPVH
jgi:hypothetical protein